LKNVPELVFLKPEAVDPSYARWVLAPGSLAGF